MAIYAGESVRIFADITGWDGNPMTPGLVQSATVTITDKYGDAVVVDGPLMWNSTVQRWMYQWESPEVAGSYDIEVVFRAGDGTSVDSRRVKIDSPRREPQRRTVGGHVLLR